MADKLIENNQWKYQRNHFAEDEEDNHDHIILSHLESKEIENSESQRKKKVVGRWTNREHEQFMTCLKQYGRDWDKLEEMIPTRTNIQIRTHAQKFFDRIKKEFNTEEPMEYVKKSLCDNSKIYKFNTFKDENEDNREWDFNMGSIPEELEMRNVIADQTNFKDESRMNLKSRNDDLMMDSMIQNQKVDQIPNNTNKRILKMNRK